MRKMDPFILLTYHLKAKYVPVCNLKYNDYECIQYARQLRKHFQVHLPIL